MKKFMEIRKSLFINRKKNFIQLFESIIKKLEPSINDDYRRNIKYTMSDYIMGIIEVLTNNVSWRKYNGKIDGRVLNNKHNYFVKIGVYEELYKTNLIKYLKRSNRKFRKYLSIDSSFIENRNGTTDLGRNIYYKRSGS